MTASVGLTIALAVLLSVRRFGVSLPPVFDDIVIVAQSSVAAACAALAAKSAEGRLRRAWWTMAAAIGAWAVADLTWVVFDYVLDVEPFPSPADFFYIVFTVLAVPAVLMMAPFYALSRRQGMVRIVLDGVTVALCAFLLAWIVVLHKVFESYREDRLALVLALLYPVADIVVLAVAVGVLARVGVAQRAVLALLVVAFAVNTVTDVWFAYAEETGTYGPGSFVDMGYAVALLAISAAASISRESEPLRLPTMLVPSNATLWAPYLPLLLAGTIGPAVLMTAPESVIVMAIVTAVVLRQGVAAWENRQLLRAAAEESLRDPLTGLANQKLFDDRLEHALMLSARGGHSVAVVSLDLDDFKLVNDTVGHPEADTLLVKVGERISECVRAGDTVARIRGDEFAVLLEGEHDDSQMMAKRVVDAFNDPFLLHGEHILLRASVGVAAASPEELDVTAHALVKRADIAMNVAKRSRSARLQTYNPALELAAPDVVAPERGTPPSWPGAAAKVRMLGELRRAIDHGELRMLYQPMVELSTGKIVGVEALLRWPHPRLGMVGPDAFLPLVRQHGLMRPVTEAVLENVLDAEARWVAEGVPTPVAVNLFAPFLRDAHLPETLGLALERRGLPAELLTVEITEDLILNEISVVIEVLGQLRERGIRVAIDDFGSGFSALSYLRDLGIDELKLDRHFIAPVKSDPRAAAVVRAVIDLSHQLGIVVVAEGVEDAATADWLRDTGCDLAQGYYYGKPMEAAAVLDLVRVAAQHS